MIYQARYAYQALLHIPDDESPWQEFMRHTANILLGSATLVCAVKNIDPARLPEALSQLSEGFKVKEFIRSQKMH